MIKKKYSLTLGIAAGCFLMLTGVASTAMAEPTKYDYDQQNRVVKITYPNGSVINLAYDAAGKAVTTSVVHPKMIRDTNGNLLRINRPDGKVVTIGTDVYGKTVRTVSQ